MQETKKTTKEDDALYEAFSPILNRLIDANFESSQDKIALQMAPLIGSAIREQIKSHKDDVVDALYPVLGNMISRYVTKTLEETLNTINQQIQNGLSFEAISRKIRAKIQGVSETQLLLNENSTSNIRAILLIHKETGIVLADAHNPNTPLAEPEMVASMMSAIKSFVNDWIDKNESHHELGEIEYGGNKIILENSGYSYLAVIVDGAAYQNTYESIRKTLESIILNYGNDIKNFNGDLNSFPNIEIYKELSSLLSSKKEDTNDNKTTKKMHPLIFIIPFFLVLFLAFNLYKNYIDNTISKNITNKISNNAQLTLYKFNIQTEDKRVVIKGNVPFQYYKDLTESLLKNVNNIENLDNQIKVVSTLQDPMQVSSNIAYLLSGLNANDGINLSYIYNYPNLEIIGNTWDEKRRYRVTQKVTQLKSIENIKFSINITPPDINKIIYFKKGSSEIGLEDELKLIELSQKLSALDNETVILINGYSDKSGSLSAKKHVVDKRVKNVTKILKEKLNISQNFKTISNYSSPADLNVSLTPYNARCVIISLQK